jgi:pyrroloquinoline quinone biosynthesis protein D
MTERLIGEESRPHLAAHRRLKFDNARNSWTVQAPERVFMLDEIAHAIVSRCDGQRTLAQIIDELSAAFAAPRDVVGADVTRLVQDLAEKGVMEP